MRCSTIQFPLKVNTGSFKPVFDCSVFVQVEAIQSSNFSVTDTSTVGFRITARDRDSWQVWLHLNNMETPPTDPYILGAASRLKLPQGEVAR